jgi:hypothetical protein
MKSELADSQVHICGACASACATALRTERQLQEGRDSARPKRRTEDVRLGEVQPWADFEFDGKPYQWRADRVLVLTEEPLSALEVRGPEKAVLDRVDVDPTEHVDEAYAQRVVERLMNSNTQAMSARSVASKWASFGVGGRTYEYRTVPTLRHRLGRCLQVSVRTPEAASHSTMALPADVTPTVDDAIMAAAAGGQGARAAVETESR